MMKLTSGLIDWAKVFVAGVLAGTIPVLVIMPLSASIPERIFAWLVGVITGASASIALVVAISKKISRARNR